MLMLHHGTQIVDPAIHPQRAAAFEGGQGVSLPHLAVDQGQQPFAVAHGREADG